MKRNSKIRTFAGFMAVALMLSTFANDYNTIAAHAKEGDTVEAEVTPAEETPTEETPVEEETPTEETPTEETPTEETPVEEETPAAETPAEVTPAAETPKDVNFIFKVSPEDAGSVSVDNGTATATAFDTYTFSNWTDNSGSVVTSDNPFTPSKPADSTITEVTYTANFSSGNTESEKPQGETTVSVNVTLNPVTEKDGSYVSIADSSTQNLSDLVTGESFSFDSSNVPTVADYNFDSAKIGGTTVTINRSGDSAASYKYTYPSDNGDVEITSGTTIDLVYSPVTKDTTTTSNQSLKVTCVDENGDPIKDYKDVDLPAFNSDGKIVLSDKERAPIEISDYSYIDAKVGSTVIASIVKETKSVDGAEQITYSYTTDGSDTLVGIGSDDEIKFEYQSKSTVSEQGLTVSCVDTDGKTIKDYEKTDLSTLTFDSEGKLALNDEDNAPIEIDSYVYKEARIDGTDSKVITSISKTVSEENGKTVYLYNTEEGTSVDITDDTKIVFVYLAPFKTVFEDKINHMTVTVKAEAGTFPEGTTVKIVPIVAEDAEVVTDNPDAYNAPVVTESADNVGKIEDAVADAVAQKHDSSTIPVSNATYDITFFDKDGDEVQPSQDKDPVDVNFAVSSDESPLADAEKLEVYHLKDDNTDKGLDQDSLDSTSASSVVADYVSASNTSSVTAEAEKFSIYVVTSVARTSLQGKMISDGHEYTVYLHENEGTLKNTIYFYSNVYGQVQSNVKKHKWTSSNPNAAEVLTSQTSGKQLALEFTDSLTVKTDTIITHIYGNSKESFTLHVCPARDLYIKDDIANSGCLVSSIITGIDTKIYDYKWYKKDSNGNFTAVTDQDALTMIGSHDAGTAINVAVNKGSLATYMLKIINKATNVPLYTSDEFQVPYADSIQNASFENPVVGVGRHYQYPNGTEGLFWKTTGTGTYVNANKDMTGHDVEICDKNDNSYNTGKSGTRSGDQEQFAELNCERDGALYQDVITAPGTTLTWGFSHRARNTGTDTMYLVIMPTKLAETGGVDGGPVDTQSEVLSYKNSDRSDVHVETMTDDNTQWTNHTGSYTVPENTYLTRFFFVAGDASEVASGNNTIGNLIDGVSFNNKVSYSISYYLNDAIEPFDVESGTDVSVFEKISATPHPQYALDHTTLNGDDYKSRTDMTLMAGGNQLCVYFKTGAISVTKAVTGLPSKSSSKLLSGYGAFFDLYDITKNADSKIAVAHATVNLSNSSTAYFYSNSTTKFNPVASHKYQVVETRRNDSGVLGYSFDNTSGKPVDITIGSSLSAGVTVTNNYSKNSYKVTYYLDREQQGNTESYDYGDEVTARAVPTKTGYTVTGWYGDSGMTGSTVSVASTMPANDLNYYAKSIANNDTKYVVYHYKVSFNGLTATIADIEELTGTTDTSVSASPKMYIGYTYQAQFDQNGMKTVASGTIAGDGSLVLRLYYTENEAITITYIARDGGSVSLGSETLAPVTGNAAGSIETPNAGYHFVNWTNAVGTVMSTDAHYVPARVGGLNVAGTYYANFEKDYGGDQGGDDGDTTPVVTPVKPTTPVGQVLGATRLPDVPVPAAPAPAKDGSVLGAMRNVVQTGDSSMMVTWGAIFAAAVAVLAVWLRKRNKQA